MKTDSRAFAVTFMAGVCILALTGSIFLGSVFLSGAEKVSAVAEPMTEAVYSSINKGDLIITPEEVMVAGDFARDGDTRYLPLRSLKESLNCPALSFPRVRELGNTKVIRKDDPAWSETVRKSLTQ